MIRTLIYMVAGTPFVAERIISLLLIAYAIVLVVGVAWLTYRPVVVAINYLDSIVNAVDELYKDDETYIQLPEDLQSVGDQLNSMKLAAIKSAQVARQAEQRKNDLVVYLAHDIRTPLTSVIGYLSLMSEAPDMPAAQRAKYVGIALDKAHRLETLVNEFFEITRFNFQSIVLQKEKINLAVMLAQIADEFYPMLAPHGKQASVDAPADLTVYADPDKLSRVLNNVLKNAASYSDPGSTITVAARRLDGHVVITCTNRGQTIPPEKLETIFQQFYRLDASRAAHTGGAGLGLAIAKEIVTAHGGTIAATSADGETVFTITLPDEVKKIIRNV